VCRAREGQSVNVGTTAFGPLVDMMDLAPVAGHVAAGMAASAFAPVQDNSLIGAGDPFGPSQIQRPSIVTVEHREVVVGVNRHPDQIGYR
jgi:hypothetical protein